MANELARKEGSSYRGGSDWGEVDFARAVKLHSGALSGRALWLTKSPSDAADLVQETILRALRSPARKLTDETVLRWLYVIMHNIFLDHCRAQAVRRSVSLDARLEEQLPPAPPVEPDWEESEDRALHACVARLPSRLREVVELYLSGESYAECARKLRLKKSTVGTRLFKAKERIRRLLGLDREEVRC